MYRIRSELPRSGLFLCLLIAPGALAVELASVDLGSTDIESGLSNTGDADGTDGENSDCEITVGIDSREGRRPRGSGDDGASDDPPDRFLYFTVTKSTVSSSAELAITATVFDDAASQDHELLLEYATERATGSDDLREVFFLHPYHHILGGTEDWVEVTWIVRDANFADHLQHATADFRISSRAPNGAFSHLCYDKVEVSTGTPAALSCPDSFDVSLNPENGAVVLSWSSPTLYDRVHVFRNGLRRATLAGDVETHEDLPPPGRYLYQLLPLKEGEGCLSPALKVEVRLFPAVSRCGCPSPDVNGDGMVDLQDLAIVTSNLDISPGNARFNIEADATHDGSIDMEDVQLVLDYIRAPGPYPTLELRMDPLATVGTVSSPGPMIRIESPYAPGSGSLKEIPGGLLHHGRLLVVSGTGSTEKLVELDPSNGDQSVFADTGDVDTNADRAVAGVAALSFEGPVVNVGNREVMESPSSSIESPVGSLARVDPSSGAPLEGTSPHGAPTGIFVGDEDAIDGRIGADTNDRPAGGFLSATAGIAEGGPGPDGPAPSSRNRVIFQTGWEYDTLRRRAFITATDLDTGLHEVAVIEDPVAGIPGPLVFLPHRGAPESLVFPDRAEILPVDGNILNEPPVQPGEGLRIDRGALDTTGARPDDRVAFSIGGGRLPSPGDYIIGITAKLAPGVLYSTLVFETGAGSVLERRLYRGALPGKLRGSSVSLPLGRLTIGLPETLVLRATEPGIILDSIELKGPVGGRLLVAMRDPGSLSVFGLAIGRATGGETIYRGLPERIFGVCDIETVRDAEVIIDPVAMDLVDLDGQQKLLLLDSLRQQVSTYSLPGDMERCVHVPLVDAYLSGMARAPGSADGSDLPTLYLGARSEGGAAGAGGGVGGGVPGGGAGASPASGVNELLDIDDIFFDREASDIVDPMGIGERRSLVLVAVFSDGSRREVTALAEYTNLDPDVVDLESGATVHARRAAGTADIRAVLQGLVAETRVLVSAAGKPFRLHRPVPFEAAPLVDADERLEIFPNTLAAEQAFGTSLEVLRFPSGYRQWFTAVKFDSSGRASGTADVAWAIDSPAGNTIDEQGVFAANESENPAAVGVGTPGEGLSLTATMGGAAAELQQEELEAEPLPLAVYDPVGLAGTPVAAIRIFPGALRVLPGSTIRFVAMLVDEDGIPRTIEAPPGDSQPNLPGARWSSDGLPIDPRTGLFRALYSGETADEVSTITVVDPVTGFSDSVDVTVLYSQVNGLESIRDAHKLRLVGSMLEAEFEELIRAADQSLLDEIELTMSNAPDLATHILEGDLATIAPDLEFLFFRLGSTFELDFSMEIALDMDTNPRLEIVETVSGEGKDALQAALRLEVTELVSATIQGFDVGLSFDFIKILEDQCDDFSSVLICDEEICDLLGDLRRAAEARPVTKSDLADEVVGSTIDYTELLHFASGRFASGTATWTSKSGLPMDRFLAERFYEAAGLSEQLDMLKEALLLMVFGRDPEACFANIGDTLFWPVSFGVCFIVGFTLNLIGVEDFDQESCRDTLTEWMETGTRDLFDTLFDSMQEHLVDLLQDIFSESVVEPYEDFLRDRYVSIVLTEAELGFRAVTGIDDVGRGSTVQFGGSTFTDPSLDFSDAPEGDFSETTLFAGEEMPAFFQSMLFSYERFSNHTVLAAEARDGFPSANPLDPGNGPPVGDVGIASTADDVLSNLLRYAGSTAYVGATGTLRGPILLGSDTVTTPDGDVHLAASSTGSPRLVLEERNPGELGGRVEQLVLVQATGALEYTVSSVVTVPLLIALRGQKVEVDVGSGSVITISAPAPGEVPLAGEIRSLVASSMANPRSFITTGLNVRLPMTVEFPGKVGERTGIGRFDVVLEGADTDAAFEDDLLSVDFVPAVGGGAALESTTRRFRRGDCNDDGRVDISDPIFLLNALFVSARRLNCRESCDFDGNDFLAITDPIYLLNWLVSEGRPLPPPFPGCGRVNLEALCPGGSHGCP